ncbi:MAG: 3-deoxy-7-phosphoheptulonate synthase [Alphaproteobacteria bacterium]|nr:3-deoxy-7-phosphoheptulonate synthase [Alphaproteobacteria bacterium]MBV9370419.1 3-deoxy-7-phosphoheptulonate synthase [Alphaproteobacteria bacterium]MBV9900841.1 3-deoxy-7-phosphoheptulonate synthase [Alphaproteobacteria bacterium]
MRDHDLARLRGEIDSLDDQLLDLVERRLALSAAIAVAKGADRAHLKLRPERQRAVVARLQAKAAPASADAVAHVWRELMAHSLERQAPTRLMLWTDGDREQLVRLVRERFGSAAALLWTISPEEALRHAAGGEAVAIIPSGRAAPLPAGVVAFEILHDAGRSLAVAAGRVAEEEEEEEDGPGRRAAPWSPGSWRERPATQLPVYRDPRALSRAERRLAGRAPLVDLHDVDGLRQRLAEVAEGKALLLQGGDCAETFREHSAARVRATADLLLDMGRTIGAAGRPVVQVARMAGQWAKPRSSLTEWVGGVELPAYQGDAVNGEAATPASRTPDPARMLRAHDQAAATAALLWSLVPDGGEPVYASHEALLLPYEQALVRYDELSDRWWSGSGHMLWIGDRTRDPAGAHVEFARGIANPIGVKCGPGLGEDDLLRLLDRLDPEQAPGRVTLIARLGLRHVEAHLPRLIGAVRGEGRRVGWIVDPMHGNTRRAAGRKTRLLADIAAETRAFFQIAAAEGVEAGGIHLELTGQAVTECLGGDRRPLAERDLGRAYLTACDPRLNPDQARDIAELVAGLAAEGAGREARAA